MHGKSLDRKRWQTDRHGIALLMAAVLLVSPVVLAGRAAAASPEGTPGAPTAKKRILVVRTQRAKDVEALVVSKIASYLDTILEMDQRIELVPAAALAAIAAPKAPEQTKKPQERLAQSGTLERADEAVEQARQAGDKKRWGDAIKAYTKAITLFDKELGRLNDFDKYFAVMLERTLAYFAAGFDDNGDEDLYRVMAMKPDLVLGDDVPKSAAVAFVRVKQRLQPAGGELRVKASAPGALVLVDGSSRGTAPATFSGLARGDHMVRVVADGYEPFAQILTVEDVTVDVEAQLTPRPGGATPTPNNPPQAAEATTGLETFAAQGEFGAPFGAAAKALAKANHLDAVLMSYVRRNKSDYELGFFVWEAARGRVAALDPATLSSDLAGLQVVVLEQCDRIGPVLETFPTERQLTGKSPLYASLEAAVVKDPVVKDPIANVGNPGDPNLHKKKKPDEDPAFYETWWFWTIIGGLAAGGTTALILTQSGGGGGSGGFTTTVSW